MQHAVKVRASVACAQSVGAGAETGSRNPLVFSYCFVPETNNKPPCLCLCGRDAGVALIISRFPCGIGSKSPPPLPFSSLMQDTLLFD